MDFKQKRELLNEYNEEALLADGFEEALTGICFRASQQPVAVYDRQKCIAILERDMSHEDAEEYFAYNVECAWAGENTPVFVINFETSERS